MFQNTQSKTSAQLRNIAERRERTATRILVIMTSSFFICWLPYATVCLVVVFGGDQITWPLLHVIPILFAKSSVCWSPLLYMFCNEEVFQAFFQTFLNICRHLQTFVDICRHLQTFLDIFDIFDIFRHFQTYLYNFAFFFLDTFFLSSLNFET